MIILKEDYRYYLEMDKIALGIKGSWSDLLTHDVWKFEKLKKNNIVRLVKKNSVR